MRVGDQDARSVALRPEYGDRLAALDDERFVVAEALEGLDDPTERVPIPSGFPGAPIDDELVRLLRVLEVVLEHPQDRLLPPAFAPERRPAGRLDSLHASHARPWTDWSLSDFHARQTPERCRKIHSGRG